MPVCPFAVESPMSSQLSISPRITVLVALVVAAALSRLLPHPMNFSPIEALALFSGAMFARRGLALVVPVAAMLLSDWFLGFHSGMPVVYGMIVLITLFGMMLGTSPKPGRVLGASVISVLAFFFVTNGFVWLEGGMYPMTGAGLLACYVAGIPFLDNQLAGALCYSTLLFGGFALLRQRFPSLSAQAA